jgi:MFS family permease
MRELCLLTIITALFEVPSNYVMKHWVRPSLWLAFLLFAWGALTIGFAGVHNYATVVVLRFLIGMFEAGFVSITSLCWKCSST